MINTDAADSTPSISLSNVDRTRSWTESEADPPPPRFRFPTIASISSRKITDGAADRAFWKVVRTYKAN